MQLLSGVFDWSKECGPVALAKNGLSNDMMDLVVLSTPNCFLAHQTLYHNSQTDVFCSLFGYLSNFESLRTLFGMPNSSAAEIAECAYNSKRLFELEGVFILLIVDERKQHCIVSQSRVGFGLPLYYAANHSSFVFATSLKQILLHSSLDRRLNQEAVHDFLHYGYMIPSKYTLLRSVHKLTPGQQIVIDFGNRTFNLSDLPDSPTHRSVSRAAAKSLLLDSIRNCTVSLSNQLISNERVLTLTSGWDCNLLLHILRGHFDGTITTGTVGAGDRFDERQRANAIVQSTYENTYHTTDSIGSDCVEALPDIVWQYEGYLFEGGVFLRHQLAQLLSKHKHAGVFLGVGADQVLFAETRLKQLLRYVKNARDPVWKFRRSFERSGPNTGYSILIDSNMKMHEMVLNTRGVVGLYPFVNRETMELSRSLGLILNWRKRYYRKQLHNILAPSVTRNIGRKKPVLDTLAIFQASRTPLMRILNSQLVQTWLDAAQIRRLREDPNKYHLIIMHLAYICLFNELFVTGRFDMHLDETSVATPLSDFTFER